MTCQDYLEKFKSLIGVVAHFGGSLYHSEVFTKKVSVGGIDRDVALVEAREEYRAVLFLLGTDPRRFSRVV